MKIRHARGSHVLGLDLSLTGTAGCVIPHDWDLDLARVRMVNAGYPLPSDATLEEQTRRVERIVRTCAEAAAGASLVCCEDHAFGLAFTANANRVIEMTGAVKREIHRDLGIIVQPVSSTRARKCLLQQVPQKGSKLFTQRNVKRLGPIALAWNDDEIDAFVVANYALMVVGGVAMTFPGTFEKAPRRTRKRTA